MTVRSAGAPVWFTDALAHVPTASTVDVNGCPIHYQRWGSPDAPGLVLVHGGAAHAHWWDHVAPMLAGEYCVVALDMSGHGDSGRRDEYSMATWAREVIAVAEHSCMPGPPIVVAHSMGGWVGLHVAAEHPDDLAGLIVLDSMVRRPEPEVEAARVGVAFGPLRVYPTVDEALAHFRTVPDQPTSLPYVLDHVARTSLVQVEGGYSWKFDPRIFQRAEVPTGDLLKRIHCRVSLFRSEHGLVSRDIGEYMYEQLGRVAPIVEVPLAWHHVMLDQPIALVTGLRALLADWEHSTPHRAS
ncbi:MAG: alpha/beta hydrolase fold protein [Actinomycetia bacterium]|nr:alpha/beta hydrolase fold protein [Actinomycetes bacterium]